MVAPATPHPLDSLRALGHDRFDHGWLPSRSGGTFWWWPAEILTDHGVIPGESAVPHTWCRRSNWWWWSNGSTFWLMPPSAPREAVSDRESLCAVSSKRGDPWPTPVQAWPVMLARAVSAALTYVPVLDGPREEAPDRGPNRRAPRIWHRAQDGTP